MTGEFIVAKIKQLDKIEGADKIVSSNLFGETIITSTNTKVGTVGLLFDIETVLSLELCQKLNLHRHSNLNDNKEVVGYFDDARRVRPIRLKGVKCSAFFLPLDGIEVFTGLDLLEDLKVGAQGNNIGEYPICAKYLKKRIRTENKEGKIKEDLVPTFKQHLDTDQALRNMQKVQVGDLAIISEKIHGTSFRCGYLLTKTKLSLWSQFFNFIANGIWNTHTNVYNFIVGSRRVLKFIGGEEFKNKQSYYDRDLWTFVAKREFEGKLEKGETIYGEIAGYDLSGGLIIGSQGNKKLKPFMGKKEYKTFIDRYGEITEFTYGCTLDEDPENKTLFNLEKINKVFVYRITTTNEDGVSMDLSWEQVKMRCEQMNVNHVPELAKFLIQEGDTQMIEDYLIDEAKEPSRLFPQHLREGVCLRLEGSSLTPKIFKEKNYFFKVIERIIKETEETNLEDEN